MSDRRPARVYGILVREGRVFLTGTEGHFGLPGGVFRPLAEDRKVELKAHLWDQLGIEASAVWAQGAFDYQHPDEERAWFSGFYSVWDWGGILPLGAGGWFDADEVAAAPGLPPSLRILLTTVINTVAMRTR
ncbi:MAG: NUDIX hydrolase [Chloroflexi bacterium]|nr:NUDIX hydrolase [Chloroflexota bacterium]